MDSAPLAHVTPLAHPRLPPGGRLWGASRPGYPGEPASPQDIQRTLREWVGSGVEAVVSLMEEWEIAQRCPGLVDACRRLELEVLRFPIVDFGAPVDAGAFGTLVLDVRGRLARGQGVLVHCNAGLGRTAVFLGSLLRSCGYPGDAVAEIRRVYKPGAMENAVQEAFVRGFAGPASAAP